MAHFSLIIAINYIIAIINQDFMHVANLTLQCPKKFKSLISRLVYLCIGIQIVVVCSMATP